MKIFRKGNVHEFYKKIIKFMNFLFGQRKVSVKNKKKLMNFCSCFYAA